MKKYIIPIIIIALIIIGTAVYLLLSETFSTKESNVTSLQTQESQEQREAQAPQASEKPSIPTLETRSVSHTQINVEWEYSGSQALFSVLRKQDSDFIRIGDALSEHKYIDTDILCGATYTYVIEAYNKEGSSRSKESNTTALNCPSSSHLTQELKNEYEQKALTTPQKTYLLNQGNDALLRIFDIRVSQNGFNPNEIIVPYGDSVQINITSTNNNSFNIISEGLQFNALIKEGKGSLSLDIPPQGIYTFSCSETCPSPEKTFIIVVL